MPGGDRTGPVGMGPMSGRSAGYCAGSRVPGYINPVCGRGFGMAYKGGPGSGCGAGRHGWRNIFYATGLPGYRRFGVNADPFGYPAPDPEIEKRVLREQAATIEAQLDSIKKRLSEIETNSSGS